MILKFISRNQVGSELFMEFNGQIVSDSAFNQNIQNIVFDEQFGDYVDRIIILRHYYGRNQDFVIGIDSNNYMLYLLNNQGQNIQKLV